MREINSIVFHVSETPENMDIGVEEIREWHLERGFDDIGYHFVIRKDGTIERGRWVGYVGAHCRGKNRDSIGVCYVGGWDGKDDRTNAQRDAMHTLVEQLTAIFGSLDVFGHYEFNKDKTCPNFNPRQEFWYIAKNGGDC